MTLPEWDEVDALLASHLFGTADRERIVARLEDWLTRLGLSGPTVTSIELSVGAAVDIALADGSRMFAKLWPPDSYPPALRAQLQTQDELARRGFPAPRLASELEQVDQAWGVLMEFDRRGEATDVRKPGVTEAMAATLAELVSMARTLPVAGMLPRHRPPKLWPKPHNALFDFEATAAGAEWIDAIARKALVLLRTSPTAIVPGHLDWSAKNMRMEGSVVAVVYDWDALYLAEESFVVGSAAASFPTSWDLPVDPMASPGQVETFVTAYEIARGARFDKQDRARIGAAVTYGRAYTARCHHATNPEEARERWPAILGCVLDS